MFTNTAKKIPAALTIALIALTAHAGVSVPSVLNTDPDSPVVVKWLKANPRIAQCLQSMLASIRNESPDAMVGAEAYAEIIKKCASYPAAAASKPMQGDMLDYDWDAQPNTKVDAKDRHNKKSWQDKNGFVHFPDGTISAHPM
jgi:hypothetical protein